MDQSLLFEVEVDKSKSINFYINIITIIIIS